MKNKLGIATAMLALASGAGIAHATPSTLAGSDTLFQFTKDMVSSTIGYCPGAAGLNYIGGGSGNGETAMKSPGTTLQYIAPMSRPLAVGATTCPASAQGYNIGLDGVSIVRDDSSTGTCHTVAFTGASTTKTINLTGGGTYTVGDFRDVLRIVYAGFDKSSEASINACFIGEPSRSAITAQNCNSAIRQELVNHWGNLFANVSGAACSDGSGGCTTLKHAFRRGDQSGTTDAFLTILALPKIGRIQVPATSNKPFCNGNDNDDNDPIRRSCSGNGAANGEQACQARQTTDKAFPASDNVSALDSSYEPAVSNTGDLGVVLDILVPEGVATTTSHNTTACDFGSFDLVEMPAAYQALGTRCPNGTSQILLKCLYPKTTTGNYGCLNNSLNVPTIGDLKNIDGRVYNMILRSGNNADANIVKDQNGVQITGAAYRLHETKVMLGATGPGGTASVGCTYADSTAQIGCLVQASPCSIGFAGREAADDVTLSNNDVRSLLLGTPDGTTALGPTDTGVQALLGTCGGTGGTPDLNTRYGLARRLWLQSILGFSAIPAAQADQIALAACEADRTKTDRLLKSNGFITLPEPAGLAPGQTCQTQPVGSGTGANPCALTAIGGGANCL